MKKTIILGLSLSGAIAWGQEKVNTAELQRAAAELQTQYEQEKLIAEQLYEGHELPEGAAFQGFSQGTPIYFAEDSQNQIKSMNVDKLGDNTLPGVAVSGDGFTAYIWDGGKVRLTHQEFGDRVTQVETTGNNSDHATGVASVLMGNGTNNTAKGMAPAANLKVLNFTTGNTISEINAQSALTDNHNYMVSNHSYGSLCGWNYNNGEGKWYWYGYPHISPNESALFGFYTSNDRNYDFAVFNAPQHSIFKSAGNNRNEGPNGIVTHYAYDETGQWQSFSGVFRPNDCMSQGGYDCLAFGSGVAKNVISVGAIKPLPGDGRYHAPSNVIATDFTSFGPTDDGRIKPDVVAIGQVVYAATNTSNNAYVNWAGTSFSSPSAAGVGVLLQQIKNEHDGGFLRADMMKALLINSAYEAGSAVGPDYRFGYGLINALGAAESILHMNNTYTADLTLNNNETYSLEFTTGMEPFKATIAWVDLGGNPLPQVVLNDRTPMLVNDLDIRITDGTNTYYPWKLDPDYPEDDATQGDNSVDNVEQIYIAVPNPNATYTLTVTHKGSLVYNKQDFALVMSGLGSLMGVNEVETKDIISVYPNPVVEQLNIKLDEQLNNAEIRVFDISGRVVYEEKVKSLNKNHTIDFKGIPSGAYMVFIKSDKGTTSKKIIKK